MLRTSITVRKAGDEHEQVSGFCEIDLVLHCAPTLKGEFARTLTVTDVHTGWTENIALKNGAHRWVLEAMPLIEARLPFRLTGIDSDNGGEFINDQPRTPHQRLVNSGALTAIQTRLIHLAAAKTTAISAATTRAKPDEARTHL